MCQQNCQICVGATVCADTKHTTKMIQNTKQFVQKRIGKKNEFNTFAITGEYQLCVLGSSFIQAVVEV